MQQFSVCTMTRAPELTLWPISARQSARWKRAAVLFGKGMKYRASIPVCQPLWWVVFQTALGLPTCCCWGTVRRLVGAALSFWEDPCGRLRNPVNGVTGREVMRRAQRTLGDLPHGHRALSSSQLSNINRRLYPAVDTKSCGCVDKGAYN